MPAVLMLESLSQVAADAAAAPRRRAAQRPRLPARRERREVPPAGRAGRSASPRDRRLAAAARRSRARRPPPTSAIRWSPKPSCCSASCPIAPTSIPPPSSIRTARIGAGTTIGPHATIGPHVALGANCRVGASAVIDGWTEIGEGTEIFPFASIGLIPQDLKFQGEETRLVIGRRNIFREFVTIHRGTRGGGGVDDDRRPQRVHGLRARRPRLPGGQRHDLRQHGDAGGHVTVEDYANIGAGSGRPPVLPRGPARVHRRLLGRHQGRAAVRADRRQPPARIFGLNTHRPDAAGFPAGRHRQAEAVVPLPAAVEAQHDERAAADRSRTVRSPARRCSTSSTSSARRSAASSCAAPPAAEVLPTEDPSAAERSHGIGRHQVLH